MSDIIAKVEVYVTELLSNKLDSNYLYHNLRHTQRVVKSTEELVENCEISDKEKEILLIAAWFHDVGYIESHADHEEKSCEIADAFLRDHNIDEKTIQNVCKTIRATKHVSRPESSIEKILRDADSSHFSKSNYVDTSELLRQELLSLGIINYTTNEWRKENINMLSSEHQYFTEYAQREWQPKKIKNIAKLVQMEKKEEQRQKKEQLKVKLKNEKIGRAHV